MKYVLRADTKEGTEYYMNIICTTQDAKDAMQYATKDEAQKDMEHFKNMFHYEEVQPIIEEYKGE